MQSRVEKKQDNIVLFWVAAKLTIVVAKVMVMVMMVIAYLNPPLHRGTARCEIGVHMDHT